MAKDIRLAPVTSTVVAPWPRLCARAKSPAAHTARLEKASPMKDSTQKGTISRQKCDWPLFPQTQRRFSVYEGIVASTLAKRLAGTSDMTRKTPNVKNSVTCDTMVEITDTPAYLKSFRLEGWAMIW